MAIENQIIILRGQKVILDSNLAILYGSTTKKLNQQVKRNLARFPEDFMFKVTTTELFDLNRSQFVTGSQKHRNPSYLPYAFTEHGAVMLASVINSEIAIKDSIEIVRTFIKLRSILAAHKELAKKLELLDRKTDNRFKIVFDLIKHDILPPSKKANQIGFETK